MKRIALMVGGAAVALGAVVLATGPASADVPDVIGETYGQAVAILKNQGDQAVFGGSTGDDLPQSQCVVIAQNSAGRSQRLRLDCKLAPGQAMPVAPNTHRLVPQGGSVPGLPDGNGNGRPTPGAGTVTVQAVPVG